MAIGAAVAAAAVSALVSSWSSAQQGLNESRRIKAQNAARIKQLQTQFDLNVQNLHNNNVSIQQNRMRNDLLIEESKLTAQDAFTQAFVGSGISGKTQDIQAAQLEGAVDKAHNRAKGIATEETDRQFLGLARQGQQNIATIEDIESFDVSASQANSNMAAMSAGISSISSSARSGSFNKS